MNESEHHPKLGVKLYLGAPVFVAGEDIFGKVEIEGKADSELGLRSIFIEVTAIESGLSFLDVVSRSYSHCV